VLASLSPFALGRQVNLSYFTERARSRGASNVARPDRARRVSMAGPEPSARIGSRATGGWVLCQTRAPALSISKDAHARLLTRPLVLCLQVFCVALLEISLSTCYTSTPTDYECLASGLRARRAGVRVCMRRQTCRPLRMGARTGAVRDVCPCLCAPKIGPSAAVRADMAGLSVRRRVIKRDRNV
jgi:hypothetical protein